MPSYTQKSTFRRWIRVSRAPFLSASALPVILGASLAWSAKGSFDAGLFALALFGIVLIHAGANLANEYFDHILGADRLNRRPSVLFGGSGSIQEGLVSPRSVLNAAIISLTAGAILGLCIVFITRSLLVFAVGVVGIIGAWCYTAPPLKLAYRTFGETTIAFLFGILPVWTTYYIQTGTLDFVPLVPATIAAILIFEVIFANEFPDASTDIQAGKRTLVVALGSRYSAIVYTAAIILSYILAAIEAFWGSPIVFTAMLMYLATAPLGLRAVMDLYIDVLDGKPRFRFNTLTILLYHVGLLLLSAGIVARAAVTR